MSDGFTPKIQIIVTAIRSRILTGDYRVGTPIPAESEIAAELNVSRGSVRKAIEMLVATGEIERERHSRPLVARRLSRVPSTDQTDVYVWLAQTVRDHTSLPFLQGISHELAGTPFRMVVREPSVFSGEVVDADERQFLVDLLSKPRVAGAIIWRDAYSDHRAEVSGLLESGMPLVFVDSPAPGSLQVDHVGTSNAASAKRCVRSLLDRGHRNIACVTDSVVPFAIGERVKGYWRAMAQAGYDPASESDLRAHCIMPRPKDRKVAHVDRFRGTFGRSLGSNLFYSDLAHRLVDETLALEQRPTALFVTYDVLAVWICAVLEENGIRIPQDISVIGFDGRSRWDRSIAEDLDSAFQDFEGFGRHAADLLLETFEGGVPSMPRQILLDAPLNVRSSTMTHQPDWPSQSLATSASG